MEPESPEAQNPNSSEPQLSKQGSFVKVAYVYFGILVLLAIFTIIAAGDTAALFFLFIPVYGVFGLLVSLGLAIAKRHHLAKPLALYGLLTLVIGFGVCTATFMSNFN